MKLFKKENFLTVYGWMYDLGLQGREVLAFAVIYGFCQDGSGKNISNEYLAQACCCTDRTIREVTNNLASRGLINKISSTNGRSFCSYELTPVVLETPKAELTPAEIISGGEEKTSARGEKISPLGEEKISAPGEKISAPTDINKNITVNNITENIFTATAQNAPAQIAKTPAPKKEPSYHLHGEYKNVRLSDDDFQKLKTEFPTDYNTRIDNLSAYIASTGKTYKNHLATIRNWARMEKQRNNQKQQERNAGFYGINENDNDAEWQALWDKADKATAANNEPYPINDFNPYQ